MMPNVLVGHGVHPEINLTHIAEVSKKVCMYCSTGKISQTRFLLSNFCFLFMNLIFISGLMQVNPQGKLYHYVDKIHEVFQSLLQKHSNSKETMPSHHFLIYCFATFHRMAQ